MLISRQQRNARSKFDPDLLQRSTTNTDNTETLTNFSQDEIVLFTAAAQPHLSIYLIIHCLPMLHLIKL